MGAEKAVKTSIEISIETFVETTIEDKIICGVVEEENAGKKNERHLPRDAFPDFDPEEKTYESNVIETSYSESYAPVYFSPDKSESRDDFFNPTINDELIEEVLANARAKNDYGIGDNTDPFLRESYEREAMLNRVGMFIRYQLGSYRPRIILHD